MPNYCQLWLTCKDRAEADKIASVLLQKHLITCAKQIPVEADFLWKARIDHSSEILLLMDSREDLFERIEAEVATIHSYDTFVLQATPVVKLSKGAAKWLRNELDG